MGTILNILVSFVVTVLKLVITTVVAIVTAVVDLFKSAVGEETLASFKEGWSEAKDNVVLALAKEHEEVTASDDQELRIDEVLAQFNTAS